jgi:hypothetical protein
MLEGEGDTFQFHQIAQKRAHKLKTKDHQIAKASSAYLTLDGEGDTFQFQQIV